jgi:hypothetical protein
MSILDLATDLVDELGEFSPVTIRVCWKPVRIAIEATLEKSLKKQML